MFYPFIHISYRQDEQDKQYHNYYYDFSDGSLFRISRNKKERIINKDSNINIPSGLGYLGYVFLALLSQFFNQFAGNPPVIICMFLIDVLSIIWIHSKVIEHNFRTMKEIKKKSEIVSLSKESVIKMMKESEMIKYYLSRTVYLALAFVIIIWSIKRFVYLGTLEFFFTIPLLYWIIDEEMICYPPINVYRLTKLLREKDNGNASKQ